MNDTPIDETQFEKKRGSYKVNIERSDDPGTPNNYHVSVRYDGALDKRSRSGAKDESFKLINAIKIGLGRQGITPVAASRDEKAAGIHLVTREFTVPADMPPTDVYAAYEQAYDSANRLLRVAAQDMEMRDTVVVDALKKGLDRHGITGSDADDIARAQLKELLKVVKIHDKKDKTR